MLSQHLHQETIRLEDQSIPAQEFEYAKTEIAQKSDFHAQLCELISVWISDSPNLIINTSGSTSSNPKQITAPKEKILNSVRYTQNFFDLKEGDTTLLCLPLGYVAGTMMVIRSLVIGMDLYVRPPCGRPLEDKSLPDITYGAMTPLQVFNALSIPDERKKLREIQNLMIVGGSVNIQMEETLRTLPNNICSTYGMAETLSHIAMRRISGENASDVYTPFHNVHLSLSKDDTLIIDAPLVREEPFTTNDLAEIYDDHRFKILGRLDNVVNSGGIKISIDLVERLLQPAIHGMFAITSMHDEKFGEALILVSEVSVDEQKVKEALPSKYYIPRKILTVDKIPLTPTEKINRKKLKNLAYQKLSGSA